MVRPPMFDPLEPAFQVDPYPGYAWLRDHEPVHHHPGDHRAPAFWALSRFEDVWQAVRRPEMFSSASGLTFFRDEIGQLGLPPTIVMLDPTGADPAAGADRPGLHARARSPRLEDGSGSFVRGRIAQMSRPAAEVTRSTCTPTSPHRARPGCSRSCSDSPRLTGSGSGPGCRR